MKQVLQISDKVYGEIKIKSPLLIDLINSRALQRLKSIPQFGMPDEFYHLKNFSRFDHSIGVLRVLQILGASEKEQVAGLIHDISHTAFCHVYDWVLGNQKNEDLQDKEHVHYLLNSDVASVLKDHGYRVEEFLKNQDFTLLDNEIPNVCADRIDYSIHEFPLNDAKLVLRNIKNYKGRIIFTDKESALLFARNFLKAQMIHWAGFEAVARYYILANALRRALENKIISKEDFWQTDCFIINKLKNSNDEFILKTLSILRNKSLNDLPVSEIVSVKKFRYVDPEFLQKDGTVNRLSSAAEDFKLEIEKARQENDKGTLVPLIG